MSITFRLANRRDSSEILELLKICLGQSSSKKTEEYWVWKHFDNPFGLSKIMIAEHRKEIIGIRVFMCWQWRWKDQVLSALRAVDTATHPLFRRRGIYSGLTQRLIELTKTRGYHFILTTPNKITGKGNLKMGWVDLGRSSVYIRLVGFNFFKYKIEYDNLLPYDVQIQWNVISELINDINLGNTNKLRTDYSLTYLKWRYHDCKVLKYYATINFNLKSLFFFRIKSFRYGRELRITDSFMNENKETQNWYLIQLKELVNITRPNLITISSRPSRSMLDGISFNYNFGPRIFFKELNYTPGKVKEVENWAYSIGDLELF